MEGRRTKRKREKKTKKKETFHLISQTLGSFGSLRIFEIVWEISIPFGIPD